MIPTQKIYCYESMEEPKNQRGLGCSTSEEEEVHLQIKYTGLNEVCVLCHVYSFLAVYRHGKNKICNREFSVHTY
jgi:hypothetical protein